ncbi:MAG: biotin/lipoyl-containing protein, partial [Planctomycetota bacterium]
MAAIDLEVPSMGESVAEATLLKWLKPDGAAVEVDEPVCEMETDKANTDMPATAAGVLKHIAKEGDTVEVGDVIATIDPDGKAEAAPVKQEKADAPAAASSDDADPMADLAPAVRR